MATIDAMPTEPQGQYAKYVKPRLADPTYREQRNRVVVECYMKRYKSDIEFRRKADEKAKAWAMEKYHTDPEWRAKKLEYGRQWRLKQKLLKSQSP